MCAPSFGTQIYAKHTCEPVNGHSKTVNEALTHMQEKDANIFQMKFSLPYTFYFKHVFRPKEKNPTERGVR